MPSVDLSWGQIVGTALGGLNLLVGLYSLWSSYRYLGYVKRRAPHPASPQGQAERGPEAPATAAARRPGVALLVPCCGNEEGLEENLRALVEQDYPDLKVIFIVEAGSDEATPVIDRVMHGAPGSTAKVVAGPARGRGQKVHNLLRALPETVGADVLAFADSDGKPDSAWLGRLVAALETFGVGVATGYRFYLPQRSFASKLRSVWNAGVLTLFGDHDHNFAWGGSMALRREVFERARVQEAWEGSLSDDYALTHAVRRAGYRVRFVPSCLVGSDGDVSLSELLRWCARQMAITRIYWPILWRIGGITQILYWSFLVAALLWGDAAASVLAASVLALTFASAAVRATAVGEIAPRFRERLRAHKTAFILLAPVASLLTVYAFVRSALSRRIEWRGKRYEMRSPQETIVLKGL